MEKKEFIDARAKAVETLIDASYPGVKTCTFVVACADGNILKGIEGKGSDIVGLLTRSMLKDEDCAVIVCEAVNAYIDVRQRQDALKNEE